MTIRVVPYQKADAEHAVAFFAEAGQADPDLKPPALADWHSFVGQGCNHGGTDFAFAEQDGKTVALLMSARYPEEGRELRNFRIVVLSSHRRQGIGERLFDVVLAQDPDGEAILQSTCHRSWKAGTRFLETREFRSVRDVFYSEGPVDQLDHASNLACYGGKMGIDATTKMKGEKGYEREWPPVVVMDPAVKDDVAAKWSDLLGRLGGAR